MIEMGGVLRKCKDVKMEIEICEAGKRRLVMRSWAREIIEIVEI